MVTSHFKLLIMIALMAIAWPLKANGHTFDTLGLSDHTYLLWLLGALTLVIELGIIDRWRKRNEGVFEFSLPWGMFTFLYHLSVPPYLSFLIFGEF